MPKLVKICGLKTFEAANKAIESGADMLGIILVPNRARTIDHNVARNIALQARRIRASRNREFPTANAIIKYVDSLRIEDPDQYFLTVQKLIIDNGPFLLGVFRNQQIDEVFRVAEEIGVDFIQLHGSEDLNDYLEFNEKREFGIVKRYVVPKDTELLSNTFATFLKRGSQNNGFMFALLDSEVGGEGTVIDWSLLDGLNGKFILAGGLRPENLPETKQYKNVVGYDVSSGVEDSEGRKDLLKIELFVRIGKLL